MPAKATQKKDPQIAAIDKETISRVHELIEQRYGASILRDNKQTIKSVVKSLMEGSTQRQTAYSYAEHVTDKLGFNR